MSELLNACNLLGWKTRERQDEILIEVCPFCGNSKFNFQISTSKFVYHCWACSVGGSLSNLAKFFPLGDTAKQRKILPKESEIFGLTIDDVNYLKIFAQFLELNKLEKNDKEIVNKFLEKRGIPFEKALEYKIRYSTAKIFIDEKLKKRYTNRIIIPLFDISGSLVYFVGRAVEENNPLKYCNCEIKRKRFLPVYLSKENPNTVILVEGVFDAIAVHRAGFSSIPLLSMNITDMQLFALLGIGFEKIVISLDPEEFTSSYKLFQKLIGVGLKPWVMLRTGQEDIDCLGTAKITEMINSLLLSNPDEVRESLLVGQVSHLLKARR